MKEDIEDLREHAQRCRRLARAVDHPETRAKLQRMAEEFDATAAALQTQLRTDEEAPKDQADDGDHPPGSPD